MTENPLDKIQTDPRPMPDFNGEVIPKGSEPGKVSWGEWAYAMFRFWRWHVAAALMVIVGYAAEYLHLNIGWVEKNYGGWIASAVFGVTGLIRGYRWIETNVRPWDTRSVEIK